MIGPFACPAPSRCTASSPAAPDAAGSSAPPPAPRAAARCSWSRSTHPSATLYFSARISCARSTSFRIGPLPNNCATALPFAAALELVDAAQNAFLDALRHRRHRVVLVVHRDVVEESSPVLVHPLAGRPAGSPPARTQTPDRSSRTSAPCSPARWLCPSWCCRPSPSIVVRPAVPAHQEALAPRVGKRPHHVPDALESEHRVVHVEGNRRHLVVRVRLCPPP